MIEDNQYLNYVPQELDKSLHNLSIEILRKFAKELLLEDVYFQYSLFHIVTKTGDFDIFNVLFDHISLLPLNPNQRNQVLNYKITIKPFHLACEFGHLQIVETLLKKDATHDIESYAKDDKGQTAFHLACKNGHSKIAEVLIQKSKNFRIPQIDYLNAKNYRKETAFHLACKNGHLDTGK